MTAIYDRILTLAQSPEGMHSSQIKDLGSTYVLSRANELVSAGRLYKARLAHKHVRFYTGRQRAIEAQRKADADAMAATQAASMKRSNASWSPKAKVVFTKATKFTKCPSPPDRFMATETPNVYGGNQRGRVMR